MLKVILLIIPIGVGLLALATWSIISAGGKLFWCSIIYIYFIQSYYFLNNRWISTSKKG